MLHDSPFLPSTPASAVTVGTFDGVHLGHRHVLDRLAATARREGLASVLVTFDPHPLEIVRPETAPALLTTPDERTELLATTPVDYVVVVRFTPELARLSAADFVDRVLRTRLRMHTLLIGHDHGFGHGRGGDTETLREIGRNRGFTVEVVTAFAGTDGRPVSSSGVRAALATGELARAVGALGRRYAVSGRVVSGARRGRLLGFRTINVAPPVRKLLPATGVYAVRVDTTHGVFDGMMNLGPRPTFGEHETTLEAHLFDATVDLYGAAVRVEFVARLRDTRRFESAAALVAQLRVDELAAREAHRALTQTL